MTTPSEPTPLSDQQVDEIIGTLLRSGVILSAAVVGLGGIWYLIQYGTTVPNYHIFLGEPKNLRSIGAIFAGAAKLDCRRIIQMGLVLLIATPVARVAFSIIGFAIERDGLYIGVTIVVLVLLILSITGDMHLFWNR
jgi:uncharacterized membrane protein